MMRTSHWRGHKIKYDNGWKYLDGTLTTDEDRPCGHCGLSNVNSHDACIANMPCVMNACCGHGHSEPYIQYYNGKSLRGEEAKNEQEMFQNSNPKYNQEYFMDGFRKIFNEFASECYENSIKSDFVTEYTVYKDAVICSLPEYVQIPIYDFMPTEIHYCDGRYRLVELKEKAVYKLQEMIT